jgi:hypothetical protein
MRAVGAIFLVVWSVWLFSQPAFAEKRCGHGYKADGERW